MNSEEIEVCIKEYGDEIYRFCCFITGGRDKADDLYQDTFLKALEVNRCIAKDDMKKFLIGIAANLWKNQWRKEKRRQKIVLPVAFNGDYMSDQKINTVSNKQDLLTSYISDETSDMVKRVVNELPEKYRMIVLMYYSVDMSTKDIAEQLHISKGTVTSRLLRARERIKKGLEEIGYER